MNPKLRQSARGRDCTFRWPGVCNHNPETTVLAHAKTGGTSRKVPDTAAFFACSACHDLYDRRDSRWREIGSEALFARGLAALIETHEVWNREGLIDA